MASYQIDAIYLPALWWERWFCLNRADEKHRSKVNNKEDQLFTIYKRHRRNWTEHGGTVGM